MVLLSAMIMEGLIHMGGEAVVETAGIGADRRLERLIKLAEFDMEIQKQKRDDIRDLLALRVDRMDMYQLVCALLMGFSMMMFCENPLLRDPDAARPSQWVLQPFLVSNISAMGLLFLSLWLSLQCSAASHSHGVQYLLQYMRVTVPTKEDLMQLERRPDAPPEANLQFEVGDQVRVEGWDPAKHVRKFLQGQEKNAIFDAYARLTLIMGVNQLMQAISYYLIADVSKQSITGGVFCVVGVQSIAVALLRLDVDKINPRDILMTLSCQVLPPLLTCIVVKYQTQESSLLNLFPSVSFILHVLWIVNVYFSARPITHETHIRAPIKFQNICVILKPDNLGQQPSFGARQHQCRPWVVTRNFLCVIGALWMCTIVWLCLWTLTTFEHAHVQRLSTKNLQVSWPKVVGFFELSGMQCNGSSIIASSRFSSYVADHAVQGVSVFHDFGRSKVETMPCNIDGCHTLTRADDGLWRLTSLPVDANAQVENVPIPFHWRAVSSVSAPCPHECHAFWVAGWDGKTEVLLGRLERATRSMSWDFRILSAVHPALCRTGKSQCELSGPSSYTEVSALQLGVEDKRLTLAVLHHDSQTQDARTVLDAWDLSDAKMLGRWSLNDKYTSMCIAGNQFLFGRTSHDGPSIEVAPLPFELRDNAEEESARWIAL